MFGLALALGGTLTSDPTALPLGVGLVLVALSLAALVASVLRATASVRLGSFRSPRD